MAAYLIDPLCCQEDHFWVETPTPEEEEEDIPLPLFASNQEGKDQSEEEEEEELLWLSTKQVQTHSSSHGYPESDPFLSWARREAVGYLVKASTHLGFTAQTTVLAVDYLDRFLSSGRQMGVGERQQPWMAQLSAVACLSLAAKVEETHVPLLLDLQVEETRFVFEAKTVQRMELLVLSTLGWKMNPVTPLAFIDHFVRRRMDLSSFNNNNSRKKNKAMGVTNRHHQQHCLEFQRRCQSILLSLIADSRWVKFVPSVMAAATMLHALGQLDCEDYLLLPLLNTTKEEVQGCYEFVLESVTGSGCHDNGNGNGNGGTCVAGNKRKCPSDDYYNSSPPSPNGIIGATFSSGDSSNDSWAVAPPAVLSSSVSSSPQHYYPMYKRPSTGVGIRATEEEGRCRPQLFRVFV